MFVGVLGNVLIYDTYDVEVVLRHGRLLLLYQVRICHRVTVLVILSRVNGTWLNYHVLRLLVVTTSAVVVGSTTLARVRAFHGRRYREDLYLRL